MTPGAATSASPVLSGAISRMVSAITCRFEAESTSSSRSPRAAETRDVFADRAQLELEVHGQRLLGRRSTTTVREASEKPVKLRREPVDAGTRDSETETARRASVVAVISWPVATLSRRTTAPSKSAAGAVGDAALNFGRDGRNGQPEDQTKGQERGAHDNLLL